jgi:hypothetical protein
MLYPNFLTLNLLKIKGLCFLSCTKDFGITMTIIMDDLLLFKATLTDQYANLIEHDVFTFEEINEIPMNSLMSRTPFGNITPFSNL